MFRSYQTKTRFSVIAVILVFLVVIITAVFPGKTVEAALNNNTGVNNYYEADKISMTLKNEDQDLLIKIVKGNDVIKKFTVQTSVSKLTPYGTVSGLNWYKPYNKFPGVFIGVSLIDPSHGAAYEYGKISENELEDAIFLTKTNLSLATDTSLWFHSLLINVSPQMPTQCPTTKEAYITSNILDNLKTCNLATVSDPIKGDLKTAIYKVGSFYPVELSIDTAKIKRSITQENTIISTDPAKPTLYQYYLYPETNFIVRKDSSIQNDNIRVSLLESGQKQLKLVIKEYETEEALKNDPDADTVDPESKAGASSTSNSGKPDTGNSCSSLGCYVSQLVAWIISLITTLIYWTFAYVVSPMIEAVLGIKTYSDQFVQVIYSGWLILRNLSNIFFIIVLLIIGLATVFQIEKYNYKHLLVQVIIAAVMVNFSLIIGQSVLGIAETVQNQFLPDKSNVIRALGYELMVKPIEQIQHQKATGDAGSTFANLTLPFFLLWLAIAAFFTFLAVLAFLVVRLVALWILLMVSPLAYVANVLPETHKYFREWWNKFLANAFIVVILGFFLNLAAVFANSHVFGQGSPIFNQSFGGTGFEDSARNFVFLTASHFTVIAFLWAGLKVASSSGAAGAKAITSFAEKGISKGFKIASGAVLAKPLAMGAARMANEKRLDFLNSNFLKPKAGKGYGTQQLNSLKRFANTALAPEKRYRAWDKAVKDRREGKDARANARTTDFRQMGMFDKREFKGNVREQIVKMQQAEAKAKDTVVNEKNPKEWADFIRDAIERGDTAAAAVGIAKAGKEGLMSQVLVQLRSKDSSYSEDRSEALDQLMGKVVEKNPDQLQMSAIHQGLEANSKTDSSFGKGATVLDPKTGQYEKGDVASIRQKWREELAKKSDSEFMKDGLTPEVIKDIPDAASDRLMTGMEWDDRQEKFLARNKGIFSGDARQRAGFKGTKQIQDLFNPNLDSNRETFVLTRSAEIEAEAGRNGNPQDLTKDDFRKQAAKEYDENPEKDTTRENVVAAMAAQIKSGHEAVGNPEKLEDADYRKQAEKAYDTNRNNKNAVIDAMTRGIKEKHEQSGDPTVYTEGQYKQQAQNMFAEMQDTANKNTKPSFMQGFGTAGDPGTGGDETDEPEGDTPGNFTPQQEAALAALGGGAAAGTIRANKVTASTATINNATGGGGGDTGGGGRTGTAPDLATAQGDTTTNDNDADIDIQQHMTNNLKSITQNKVEQVIGGATAAKLSGAEKDSIVSAIKDEMKKAMDDALDRKFALTKDGRRIDFEALEKKKQNGIIANLSAKISNLASQKDGNQQNVNPGISELYSRGSAGQSDKLGGTDISDMVHNIFNTMPKS